MNKIRLQSLDQDRFKEVVIRREKKKWVYVDPAEQNMPAFERCVELAWLDHKILQVPNLSGSKLIDFGCNKAKYIQKYKDMYGLKTYGIDIKKEASKFVDRLFCGEFNNNIVQKVKRRGTFQVATAISAIEHAGYSHHPDNKYITDYQKYICRFLIDISKFLFITVPYGSRPGWISGIGSKKNLYQFNADMLAMLKTEAHDRGKKYVEEIYKYDKGYWAKSDKESTKDCIYRPKKQGASAVALISIYDRWHEI